MRVHPTLRMLTRALGLVAVICALLVLLPLAAPLLCSYLPRCSRTLHLIYRTNCPLPATQVARPAPAIRPIQSRRVRHSSQHLPSATAFSYHLAFVPVGRN